MNHISRKRVLDAVEDLSNRGSDFYFSATSISYRLAENIHDRPNDDQIKGILETLVEEGEVSRVIIPSGNRFNQDGKDLLKHARTFYRAKSDEERK